MVFESELNNRVDRINEIIEKYMPISKGNQKTVIDAMHYSVNAGGKRVRPMLMNETFKLLGGCDNIIEPFMAAIEMIHTYSLVHDDLPAMDDDEYRRGKKSTHAMYGEAMGILAGDALLNYAFETAASAFEIKMDVSVARAMKVLGSKAGIYGMIGGQVADTESEGRSITLEELRFIHKYKCGALIESAMMIGAILAKADDDTVNLIESIGADIGFAFQIQDDVLDVTGSEELLGKPIGSDEKNQKNTYVSIVGLNEARSEVERLSKRALENISRLPEKNEFLEELIHFMIYRSY